jgi:hypothetical protein
MTIAATFVPAIMNIETNNNGNSPNLQQNSSLPMTAD